MNLFPRTRFVLTETSHPGNVGAAACAVKNMGFGRLVLADPQCGVEDPRRDPAAVAMASGADDVLSSALIVPDLDAALAEAGITLALTARQREFGPPRLSPREAGAQDEGAEIAFVFGNERYGLPNEAVDRCRMAVHIPANPDYASLNLAQAVQLMAYEARLAWLEAQGAPRSWPVESGFVGVPANHREVEEGLAHLEEALVEIGFLDPDNPRKLMPRLRRLFARAGLEREEVNILRGIARSIIEKRARR
ncbi:MAG: RNA methyltransferase [Candidatus Protistobacter heckmanni]|nr:RNA methyltransferase [Candidatus Protistobacter heckmanni]